MQNVSFYRAGSTVHNLWVNRIFIRKFTEFLSNLIILMVEDTIFAYMSNNRKNKRLTDGAKSLFVCYFMTLF